MDKAFGTIAKGLREFGYPDVTAEMIREVHDAWINSEDLPHGVVGMFAKGDFEQHPELFGEPSDQTVEDSGPASPAQHEKYPELSARDRAEIASRDEERITLQAENERLRAANERHLATHRLNIETMSVTASRLEAKDMGIYELTTAMDETRAAIKAAKGGE